MSAGCEKYIYETYFAGRSHSTAAPGICPLPRVFSRGRGDQGVRAGRVGTAAAATQDLPTEYCEEPEPSCIGRFAFSKNCFAGKYVIPGAGMGILFLICGCGVNSMFVFIATRHAEKVEADSIYTKSMCDDITFYRLRNVFFRMIVKDFLFNITKPHECFPDIKAQE